MRIVGDDLQIVLLSCRSHVQTIRGIPCSTFSCHNGTIHTFTLRIIDRPCIAIVCCQHLLVCINDDSFTLVCLQRYFAVFYFLDYSLSKEYKAFNGDGGVVKEVKDGKITLETDKGKTVIIDTNKQMLAADYGYARTVNDSQGKSVDGVIAIGESATGDTANSLYVALTRMKKRLIVITDNVGRLCKTAEKWAEKNLAGTSRERVMDAEQVKDLETQLEKGKENGKDAAQYSEHAQEKEDKENKKQVDVINEENKREESQVLEELEM